MNKNGRGNSLGRVGFRPHRQIVRLIEFAFTHKQKMLWSMGPRPRSFDRTPQAACIWTIHTQFTHSSPRALLVLSTEARYGPWRRSEPSCSNRGAAAVFQQPFWPPWMAPSIPQSIEARFNNIDANRNSIDPAHQKRRAHWQSPRASATHLVTGAALLPARLPH